VVFSAEESAIPKITSETRLQVRYTLKEPKESLTGYPVVWADHMNSFRLDGLQAGWRRARFEFAETPRKDSASLEYSLAKPISAEQSAAAVEPPRVKQEVHRFTSFFRGHLVEKVISIPYQ